MTEHALLTLLPGVLVKWEKFANSKGQQLCEFDSSDKWEEFVIYMSPLQAFR